MYRKIIVGHDLHEGGEDALALGRLLAEATGAELVVAGIFPIGDLPRGFEAEWREHEEEVAKRLQGVADAVGAVGEGFPSSSPARGLHHLGEELDADLVVVGSSRHSTIGRILAGDVALGLLHGAPFAVAIAPRGHAGRAAALGSITHGFDGSDEAAAALEGALDLARAARATLRLVAVAAPPPFSSAPGLHDRSAHLVDAIEKGLRTQLDQAVQSIPAEVTVEAELVRGDPTEELVAAAAGQDGLLVLGSRGYGPIRRVLLGSVSSALVRSAPCPVLVHPRPGEDA